MIEFFRKAWRGEERLWKVWWLVGVPLGILGGAVSVWLEEASKPGSGMSSLFPTATFFALVAAYFAWCNMAWGCAKNVETKVWGTIAKVLIILGLMRFAIDLIKAFQR